MLARVGVVVALTVGACGAGTAAGATPPAPAPPPAPALPAAAPAPAPAPVPVEPWDSLVRCETGGDWYLDTGNGYQGGLQLSPRTWQAYGGGQFTAEADEASREHQILVGDRVRAEQGWEAWGGCSEELGLT